MDALQIFMNRLKSALGGDIVITPSGSMPYALWVSYGEEDMGVADSYIEYVGGSNYSTDYATVIVSPVANGRYAVPNDKFIPGKTAWADLIIPLLASVKDYDHLDVTINGNKLKDAASMLRRGYIEDDVKTITITFDKEYYQQTTFTGNPFDIATDIDSLMMEIVGKARDIMRDIERSFR